jgi:hypothetical protein
MSKAYALHSGVQRVIGYLLRDQERRRLRQRRRGDHGVAAGQQGHHRVAAVADAGVLLARAARLLASAARAWKPPPGWSIDKRDVHILDVQRLSRYQCEKFALVPTSVISFAEGTRFTPAKHEQQHSPYRHLLKPRAGALALTLNAMGARFHALLDVTIVYPAGAPTFWQFLCGRVPRIIVRVRELPIPASFGTGDYVLDRGFRREFQHWLGGMWEFKDAQISALLPQDRVLH